jgi:hypothetical protein
LELVTFRRMVITWIFTQDLAFLARLLIHPQGHFSHLDASLLALGFGMATLAGLGIASIYWLALRFIAWVGSKLLGQRSASPWFTFSVMAFVILSGVYVLSEINQVFVDGDPYLFTVMVTLATFASVRSLSWSVAAKSQI